MPLPENPALWAPVGFATTLPEHLEFLSYLAFTCCRRPICHPSLLYPSTCEVAWAYHIL
jgi:hypothetical protein